MADFTGYNTGQRTRVSKRVEPARTMPNYSTTEGGQATPNTLPTEPQGATPTGKPVNRSATQGWEQTKGAVATAIPVAGAFKAVGDAGESAGIDESIMDPFGNKVTKLEEGDTDAVIASVVGGPIGGFLHNKDHI